MRCALALLLLALAGCAVADEGSLLRLQARLDTSPVLRGAFEQEKIVKGFRNPLRSSGHFTVVRGQGVLWDTRAPFASSITLGPAGLPADAGGGVDGRIGRLLLAMLELDLEVLQQSFAVDVEEHADGWTLELLPRSDVLAAQLTRLQLSGGRFVQTVRVVDAEGNRTEIQLRDIRPDSAALSNEEARRLE